MVKGGRLERMCHHTAVPNEGNHKHLPGVDSGRKREKKRKKQKTKRGNETRGEKKKKKAGKNKKAKMKKTSWCLRLRMSYICAQKT